MLVVGAPIKSDHTLSVATDGKDSFSNKSFNLITGGRYGAVSYAISSSRTNGKKNSQARSLNLPNKNQLHFPSRYLFPTLAHLWDFRQIFLLVIKPAKLVIDSAIEFQSWYNKKRGNINFRFLSETWGRVRWSALHGPSRKGCNNTTTTTTTTSKWWRRQPEGAERTMTPRPFRRWIYIQPTREKISVLFPLSEFQTPTSVLLSYSLPFLLYRLLLGKHAVGRDSCKFVSMPWEFFLPTIWFYSSFTHLPSKITTIPTTISYQINKFRQRRPKTKNPLIFLELLRSRITVYRAPFNYLLPQA